MENWSEKADGRASPRGRSDSVLRGCLLTAGSPFTFSKCTERKREGVERAGVLGRRVRVNGKCGQESKGRKGHFGKAPGVVTQSHLTAVPVLSTMQFLHRECLSV